MRKTVVLTVIAGAALLLACGSDEGPVGVEGVRYWDIAWSSPDTILTDIEMLGEKLGYACGYRYNATTGTNDALIYAYDGEKWDVSLFMPGESGATLTALDFVAENNGWALGYRESEVFPGPVVLHYDGEAWTELPTDSLNGGRMTMLAAADAENIWVSDGYEAYHYGDGFWSLFPLSQGGTVDHWTFSGPEAGWAVDYGSGYCYKWDGAIGFWTLESHPLYNATSFFFRSDGSGVYADFVDIPPVTRRTNIYVREGGESPSYKRVFASGQGRYLTACDFFPPDYYFFAGPNAAFEVVKDDVAPLGYVPSGELGTVRAISIAAQGDVWGIMGTSLDQGPSFIVHKKG